MKAQDYHKALDELERLQRENAELRECVEWWERKCGRIESKLAAAEAALESIRDGAAMPGRACPEWLTERLAIIDAAKTEAKA